MDDLEFPASLKGLTTAPAVLIALRSRMLRFGYGYYAIGMLPRADFVEEDGFLYHNWPDAWVRTYFQHGYGPDDPLREAGTFACEPVTLSEIRDGKAGFMPTARGLEMLDTIAGFGLVGGLVIPIFGPSGYRGIVTMNGDGPDPSPGERALLHLWAIYAHNRLRELYWQDIHAGETPLTPREVEVLRGARNGLEDEAIARLMAISVRTVRFHFDNAKRKLGCRTRPEAVATADNMHIIR